MRTPGPWSLERRLIKRLLIVTVLVTLITSLVVGLHYGSDIADLRQRKVLERAEQIAVVYTENLGLLAGQEQSFGDFFAIYPEAYGWRVIREGRTLAASSFAWENVEDIPSSGPEEWTHRLDQGGWVAGKRFSCGGSFCEAQVIALSDPADLLGGLMLQEIAVHVVLPILLFAVLLLAASRRVIRTTLNPLSRLAQHAGAVRAFGHVEPIKLSDAPIEVAELAAALNATLARLQSSLERERAFILDAAHSLRTPVAALRARLDIDGDAVDPSALRADLEDLTRLCAQLLNSAHADRLVINRHQRIDADALIVNTIAKLDYLARQKGVLLAYERRSGQSLINADEDALAIALTNLLENAIGHAPKGSEVLVTLLDSPLRISVADSGAGIPKDKLEDAITPFVRGRGAREPGAGLGLSIVSRIMEIHGGQLLLTCNQPRGLVASLVFASARS